MRVISYGGGVQSTALIVLAVQRRIDADLALFSNVGDDSEHPATLTYVRDVMIPWATARKFRVEEIQRRDRAGHLRSLAADLMNETTRSVPIPVRMSNGAPGRRSCTVDYKIKVISRRLREMGAAVDNPATVLIGFSTDEIHRVARRRDIATETAEYPLLDLGLSRSDCINLIADAGLPVPPKSACFFCPFTRPQTWAEMRRDEPELFDKALTIERRLNETRTRLHRDPVWLTRFNRPLDQAIYEAGPTLFDDGPESCDDGYCWT